MHALQRVLQGKEDHRRQLEITRVMKAGRTIRRFGDGFHL